MGARKPFSSGKIANKLKGYENPFTKSDSKLIKNDMLNYYRKSKESHILIDERNRNVKLNRNKFSLEDHENYENDYSLGDCEEPVSDLPIKPKISDKIIESKMKKIEKRIAKDEAYNKLSEIDRMFDDIRQDLSFKRNITQEIDEFDSIKNKFSLGFDVKISKSENRILYTKLIKSIDLSIDKIKDSIKSASITGNDISELLDFCIELISRRLRNREDWWDLTRWLSPILLSKYNKTYNYFLTCIKIMYKNLLSQSNNIQQYYKDEVETWEFDSSCGAYIQLINGNSDIELSILIFAIALFPVNPKDSDPKLGYIALLYLDHIARISLDVKESLHYEYFTVLYTVALEHGHFVPVLFQLAKKIISNDIKLPVDLVEQTISSCAIILKRLSNASNSACILSHLFNDIESLIKKFKNGHLLIKVINEMREAGLEPLSMLNSQPNTCIMETPKLILWNKNLNNKDGLKKAILREKKRVSKMILQESKVIKNEQISRKLEQKKAMEERYKHVVSQAMIEREELKKEATRGRLMVI